MPKSFAIALLGALLGALIVCSLAIFSATATAGHFGQTKTVGGVVIYLGVVPAAVLRQHPDDYPSHEVGNIPSGKHVHHVMLALFDRPGGKRITNAVVTARVAPLALAGSTKPLDPMMVAGVLSYCNYFRISPSDTTVIQAEIRRPDAARVIHARFIVEPYNECCQAEQPTVRYNETTGANLFAPGQFA